MINNIKSFSFFLLVFGWVNGGGDGAVEVVEQLVYSRPHGFDVFGTHIREYPRASPFSNEDRIRLNKDFQINRWMFKILVDILNPQRTSYLTVDLNVFIE